MRIKIVFDTIMLLQFFHAFNQIFMVNNFRIRPTVHIFTMTSFVLYECISMTKNSSSANSDLTKDCNTDQVLKSCILKFLLLSNTSLTPQNLRLTIFDCGQSISNSARFSLVVLVLNPVQDVEET